MRLKKFDSLRPMLTAADNVFAVFGYSEEVSTNSDQWLTIMLINIIIKNPSNGDNMSIRIDKCRVNSSKTKSR